MRRIRSRFGAGVYLPAYNQRSAVTLREGQRLARELIRLSSLANRGLGSRSYSFGSSVASSASIERKLTCPPPAVPRQRK